MTIITDEEQDEERRNAVNKKLIMRVKPWVHLLKSL